MRPHENFKFLSDYAQSQLDRLYPDWEVLIYGFETTEDVVSWEPLGLHFWNGQGIPGQYLLSNKARTAHKTSWKECEPSQIFYHVPFLCLSSINGSSSLRYEKRFGYLYP